MTYRDLPPASPHRRSQRRTPPSNEGAGAAAEARLESALSLWRENCRLRAGIEPSLLAVRVLQGASQGSTSQGPDRVERWHRRVVQAAVLLIGLGLGGTLLVRAQHARAVSAPEGERALDGLLKDSLLKAVPLHSLRGPDGRRVPAEGPQTPDLGPDAPRRVEAPR